MGNDPSRHDNNETTVATSEAAAAAQQQQHTIESKSMNSVLVSDSDSRTNNSSNNNKTFWNRTRRRQRRQLRSCNSTSSSGGSTAAAAAAAVPVPLPVPSWQLLLLSQGQQQEDHATRTMMTGPDSKLCHNHHPKSTMDLRRSIRRITSTRRTTTTRWKQNHTTPKKQNQSPSSDQQQQQQEQQPERTMMNKSTILQQQQQQQPPPLETLTVTDPSLMTTTHTETETDIDTNTAQQEQEQQQQILPTDTILSFPDVISTEESSNGSNSLASLTTTTTTTTKTITTPSSPSSSSKATVESNVSLASMVEQIFQQQQHEHEEEEQKEDTFAATTTTPTPLDSNTSTRPQTNSNSSSGSNGNSSNIKKRRHHQPRIIQVYQTYSTSLIPRSQLPEALWEDEEQQQQQQPPSIHQTHIPFRKCHRWECICHNNDNNNNNNPLELSPSKQTISVIVDVVTPSSRVPSCNSSDCSSTSNNSDTGVQVPQLQLAHRVQSTNTMDTAVTDPSSMQHETNNTQQQQQQQAPSCSTTTSIPLMEQDQLVGLLIAPSYPSPSSSCRNRKTTTTTTTATTTCSKQQSVPQISTTSTTTNTVSSSSSSPTLEAMLSLDTAYTNSVPAAAKPFSSLMRSRADSQDMTMSSSSKVTRTQRARSEDVVDGGSMVVVNTTTANTNTTRTMTTTTATTPKINTPALPHSTSPNNDQLPPRRATTTTTTTTTKPSSSRSISTMTLPATQQQQQQPFQGIYHQLRRRSEDYLDSPVAKPLMVVADNDGLAETLLVGSPTNLDRTVKFPSESPTSVTTDNFPMAFSQRKDFSQNNPYQKDHTISRHHHHRQQHQQQQQKSSSSSLLEKSLDKWRLSLDAMKHQANWQSQSHPERALQRCKIYYHMGLLHYQLCRYTTAMHVLDHAVETLIQNVSCISVRSNCIHDDDDILDSTPDPSHLPLLHESMPYLSNEALLLVGTIFTVQAKIDLAQGTWELAKSRMEQVLLTLGHERIVRGIGPPQPFFLPPFMYMLDDVATEWSLTMARAQVVLGQFHQQDQRPDLAMQCFQDALTMQRYCLGDHHLQVADTVHKIGNLHTSQNLLGPAAACYHEALRVYQLPCNSSNMTNHNCNHNSTAAEVATLLASLGWIALLQHDFTSSFHLSQQALGLTLQSLGPHHRNVASIRYQLGWMTWWSNASNPSITKNVLSTWKTVLKHQELVLFPKQPSSQKTSNDDDGKQSSSSSSFDCQRRRHVDLAKTLHAMGHAYKSLSRYEKADTILQAADAIYQENMPKCRQGCAPVEEYDIPRRRLGYC
ncbi:serine/threonine protein kinase [Nitzschia inconspicua]|uniref:Serine/threonine protein kinase n=1 Tax=Nitzschia inconspicua TaxID=303405 RepID=A0A9K3LKE4_9STRA|nr:serine/threonine protein kinase [Nitzschia inconspicua]